MKNPRYGFPMRTNYVRINGWLSQVLKRSPVQISRLFAASYYDPETVRKYLEKQGFSTKRVRSPVRAQSSTQQK